MEKALTKTISKVARKARVALGLTQEGAAEKIGVSVEFYSRIERGRALPSLKTLIRIAVAFGVSTDKLLGIAEGDDVESAIEQYKAPQPDDPPELKRLFRRLRKSSKNTWRVAEIIVKELEKVPDKEDKDKEKDGAKRGTKTTKKRGSKSKTKRGKKAAETQRSEDDEGDAE
ncbi:MAG: helix-turn-helix domain-containing protein [Proteobacteria bacterium]|nr:helix-turn-helix domain-containing protein [Pseudomonadota bacterium]